MALSKKQRTSAILELLDQHYGVEKICYLDYKEPWQLLIAVILSAQCTDARVNLITPGLFAVYPSIEALASAEVGHVEELIRSAGFYKNKAKNIVACCNRLLLEFGGELPESIEDLTSLAGVGRKTANVIRGNIYNDPSIVVDTHVKRISNKLGLTKSNDPEKIEYDLMKVLPKEHWIRYNMQVITLGRESCIARRPQCGRCFLREHCPSTEV